MRSKRILERTHLIEANTKNWKKTRKPEDGTQQFKLFWRTKQRVRKKEKKRNRLSRKWHDSAGRWIGLIISHRNRNIYSFLLPLCIKSFFLVRSLLRSDAVSFCVCFESSIWFQVPRQREKEERKHTVEQFWGMCAAFGWKTNWKWSNREKNESILAKGYSLKTPTTKTTTTADSRQPTEWKKKKKKKPKRKKSKTLRNWDCKNYNEFEGNAMRLPFFISNKWNFVLLCHGNFVIVVVVTVAIVVFFSLFFLGVFLLLLFMRCI